MPNNDDFLLFEDDNEYEENYIDDEEESEDEYEYEDEDYDYEDYEKGNKTKKIIIFFLILVIIAGLGTGYYFKDYLIPGESLPTIVGFNDDNVPIDKNGNVISPIFDDYGNPIIIPIDPELLAKLGVTQEDYEKGHYNPFFQLAGKSISALSQVVDVNGSVILKNNGQPLLKEKGRLILRDPAGTPVLSKLGEVIYLDSPFLPDSKWIEESTGLSFNSEDNSGDTEIKYEDLPEEFFEEVENSAKIKETHFKDLGISFDTESDNKFIIYNHKGTLKPLISEGYTNREILGRYLTYNLFKDSIEYKIEEKITEGEKFFTLRFSFDREKERIRLVSIIQFLKTKGWYSDLNNRKTDEIVEEINSKVDKQLEFVGKQDFDYIKGLKRKEGDKDSELSKIIDENIDNLEKTSRRNFDNSELIKMCFDIYKINVKNLLKFYSDEAVKELIKIKPELKLYKISTLELRSEYIEKIYIEALQQTNIDMNKAVNTIYKYINK